MTRGVVVLLAGLSALGGCIYDFDNPNDCMDDEGLFYPLEDGSWWRYQTRDAATGEPVCPHKVVSIRWGESDFDARPGVDLFRVHSERADSYALRYQELLPSGSVLRHFDEWYGGTDRLTEVELFCPSKLRVPDGDLSQERMSLVERWVEVTITTQEEGASFDEEGCDHIIFDDQTCEVIVGQPPAGCAVTAPLERWKSWSVDGLCEEVEVPAGRFRAKRLRTRIDHGEVATWWWVRGVGKVKELKVAADGDEDEELVDYCIAPGCDRPPPSFDELQAECQ